VDQIVMPPTVSVIIPAFNAERYIEAAIASILAQSYTDFEVLVIDDGSTDGTAEKIKSLQADVRVRYFYQANQGPSAARNYGVALAAGRLLTCMDADDISHPERLQKQIDFMDSHPHIGVCGSWGETIEESGSRSITPPADDAAIRAFMLLDNCFIHSSVMMRRELLRDMAPVYKVMLAEDYELWFRLGERTQLHNLPERLIRYRIHPAQISARQSTRLVDGAMLVRERQLELLLGAAVPAQDIETFKVLLDQHGDNESTLRAAKFAVRLLEVNNAANRYDRAALSDAVFSRVRRLFKAADSPLATKIFGLMYLRKWIHQFGFSRSLRLLRSVMGRAR
jgi:glycosyltransferase involved in cell wall biosynthesis